MNKNARLLVSALALFLMFIIGLKCGRDEALNAYKNSEHEKLASDVFKTVAHIDMTWNKNVERIYVDFENDVAYYRRLDGKPFYSKGDTVFVYTGEPYEISYVDIQQFRIKPLDKDVVVVGYSGTAITDEDGKQLGYISEIDADGNVTCIWN